MSPKEPFVALGVAAVWGMYGAFYFVTSGKKKGKTSFCQLIRCYHTPRSCDRMRTAGLGFSLLK